jgi:hypothetical protein
MRHTTKEKNKKSCKVSYVDLVGMSGGIGGRLRRGGGRGGGRGGMRGIKQPRQMGAESTRNPNNGGALTHGPGSIAGGVLSMGRRRGGRRGRDFRNNHYLHARRGHWDR